MNSLKGVNKGEPFILEDKQVIYSLSLSVLTEWIYENAILTIVS